MSTPQANTSGVKVKPDQGRVTAVAVAHDRHSFPVRYLIIHRPVHDVDQVVVHLARPLPVAGVQERLAEAGRAAVVHRDHRVAAIRQKLVDGVVTSEQEIDCTCPLRCSAVRSKSPATASSSTVQVRNW